ncbi:hypothetical protein BDR07DRAFT_1566738 [Suillus spraguei]|nr:hypothetical protein BDR07DRAFT_1566738 [Suillus spraguei]
MYAEEEMVEALANQTPQPSPPVIAAKLPQQPENGDKMEQLLSGNEIVIVFSLATHRPRAFIAPVPAALIHTLRIVKQPKAHIRTTSMSSVGSSSTGSSAEKVVAPTVPRSAIHKPILTDVRCPPSELMPATLEANIFCMLEQDNKATYQDLQIKAAEAYRIISKALLVKIPTASHTTAVSKSARPPSCFATVGIDMGLLHPAATFI